jgi:hypothetical protein
MNDSSGNNHALNELLESSSIPAERSPVGGRSIQQARKPADASSFLRDETGSELGLQAHLHQLGRECAVSAGGDGSTASVDSLALPAEHDLDQTDFSTGILSTSDPNSIATPMDSIQQASATVARHIAGLPSMLARSVLIRLIASRELRLPLLRLFQGIEISSLSLRPCRAYVVDAWMPIIGTFLTLQELDLSECHLLSDQGIRLLAFRDDHTEDPSPVSMCLRSLSLHSCLQLSNAAVLHLGLFPRLERIDLSDCTGLSNAALQFLAERFSTQLKALSVARCERIGSSSIAALFHNNGHAERGMLKSRTPDGKDIEPNSSFLDGPCRLELLDVSGCPAVGEYAFQNIGQRMDHPEMLISSAETSSALSVLRLRGCSRINDTVCEYIGALHPNLQELDLYGCVRVTDRGVMDLAKSLSQSLEALCLTETQISDQGLVALGQLRSLRRLHLTRCRQLQLHAGVMHDFCTRMAAQGNFCELRLRSLSAVNSRVLAEMSCLFLRGSLTHLNLTDCRQVDDEALSALHEAVRAQRSESWTQHASGEPPTLESHLERPPCCLVQSLSLRNTAIRNAGLVLKVFGGIRHLDLGECTTLDNLEKLFHDIAEQEEAVRRIGRRWMRHQQRLLESSIPFKSGSSERTFTHRAIGRNDDPFGPASFTDTRPLTDATSPYWRTHIPTGRDELRSATRTRLVTEEDKFPGIPAAGPWLNTLEYLDLSQCQTLCFSNLRTLRSESLRILILDHCPAVTNACVALLAYHVPNLQELSLRFTAVGDLGIAAFANRLRHLEKLHLRGLTQVTHAGLRRLAASPLASRLRVLELAECTAIDELALEALNGFKVLEYLSLKGCPEINDAALRRLQQVPALTVLNLRQCPLVTAKHVELLQKRLPGLVEVKWSGEATGTGKHAGASSALVDSFLAYVHAGSRVAPIPATNTPSQRHRQEHGPLPTRAFLDMFDAWEMRQRSPRRGGASR